MVQETLSQKPEEQGRRELCFKGVQVCPELEQEHSLLRLQSMAAETESGPG